MRRSAQIKTGGYVISTLSVVLLGIVSLRSVSDRPLLLICLIAGMAASVIGMALRWLSYRMDKD